MVDSFVDGRNDFFFDNLFGATVFLVVFDDDCDIYSGDLIIHSAELQKDLF